MDIFKYVADGRLGMKKRFGDAFRSAAQSFGEKRLLDIAAIRGIAGESVEMILQGDDRPVTRTVINALSIPLRIDIRKHIALTDFMKEGEEIKKAAKADGFHAVAATDVPNTQLPNEETQLGVFMVYRVLRDLDKVS